MKMTRLEREQEALRYINGFFRGITVNVKKLMESMGINYDSNRKYNPQWGMALSSLASQGILIATAKEDGIPTWKLNMKE